jgi:transcriptional regulator with XRE-family HTH domain
MKSEPRIGSPTALEFGAFLRSRREALRPADVGLPDGPRRRTKGLRRDEVAMLAGISSTYYVFLEQGRDIHPSANTVEALSQALCLDPSHRRMLYELGGLLFPEPLSAAETLHTDVQALMDELDPHPAYVIGGRWDVLGANRGARLLWTDWTMLPPEDRNMLLWMFTDPNARLALRHWEREARALLGRFRLAVTRHARDPVFQDLVMRLQAASPEMRAWWPRAEVAPVSSGTKLLRHPALGMLNLSHTVFQITDSPEQRLICFRLRPDDEIKVARLIKEKWE